MPVQEIVLPKISGVYMLGELQHRYSQSARSWSCGFSYYIGQSVDVAYRLTQHRNDCWSGFTNPRALLLAETRLQDRLKRLRLETNFIVAARQLQLPLFNKQVANGFRTLLPFQVEEEKRILEEALLLLTDLTKTAWNHPGNLPCSFTVAA